MEKVTWWQDGIIYQIYPRSFADTNGDGLGDLPGITGRLDYLAELGVDAIWLSPIYPSPDADFGYDVANHSAVDPRFGSLEDFDRLVAEAHRRGIRIILDMVMNHTSDRHPWFTASRSGRGHPKRDWYIWRDRPNNWQSVFGGRAWEFDPSSGQYFYHMYLKEQPDVNWRNPEVRKAQLDVFRFWLERGVDGFRLDVFNVYFKDSEFRDNPAKLGLRSFDRQLHLHDCDQPEMIPLLNELRLLLDSYPDRYAVGEIFNGSAERAASYVGDRLLHAAFSFDFISRFIHHWNSAWLRRQIARRENFFASGRWPTTVVSHHDIPRTASRYAKGEADARAKIAMALLLTLRGTPFMYYGEEIGMRDVTLRRREIMDPPGRRYWPLYKGRDGCRAPMQWDATANAGFSTVRPWLPVHPDYTHRNVAAQRADPDSMFNFTRKLIAIRKEYPALRRGEQVLLSAPDGVLLYERRTTGQAVLVAINLTAHAVRVLMAVYKEGWQPLFSSVHDAGTEAPPEMVLAPHEIRMLFK